MYGRSGILKPLAALGLAAVVAGCSSMSSEPDQPGAPRAGAGNAIVNDKSVQEILSALGEEGLAVPNARDVTASACPDIGCVSEVDTDTIAILKFPTTGKAEIYAGEHRDVFVVTDTVVRFTPAVPDAARDAYRKAVTQAIQ